MRDVPVARTLRERTEHFAYPAPSYRLFRSIQEPLYRRVLPIAAQRELAEYVVQDVFVILQRKLRWLREPRHFRAWAFRIAAREAYRHVARERRTQTVEDDSLSDVPDPRAEVPLRRLAAEELLELVRELPAGSRAVLTLHYLDDLPISDVARALGLPLGTAKSRLSYGLGVLRRRLGAGSAGIHLEVGGSHEQR